MASRRQDDGAPKLNLRMSERLQARVEKDASKRGLSMNAAIISRLEASFRHEQQLVETMENVLGGPRSAALFRTLAARAAFQTGDESWLDDYGAFNSVLDDWWRSLKGIEPPMPDLFVKRIAAAKRLAARLEQNDLSPDLRETLLGILESYVDDDSLPADVRAELAATLKKKEQ